MNQIAIEQRYEIRFEEFEDRLRPLNKTSTVVVTDTSWWTTEAESFDSSLASPVQAAKLLKINRINKSLGVFFGTKRLEP